MKKILPMPSRHHSSATPYIPPDLLNAKSVYVCHDGVRRPLQTPCDGPFCVLSAGDKFFTISRNGSPYTVLVDRLKVAIVPSNYDVQFPPLPEPMNNAPSISNNHENQQIVTRSGRVSRPPERLIL